MEYYCHIWAGPHSSYLDILDTLKKWVCRRVDTTIASSLVPLTHCKNVASIGHFYRYYFGRCSYKLTELVPHP